MYILWDYEVSLGVYLMPPKTKTKKFNRRKNFQAIPFSDQLALSTLGEDTILSKAPTGAVTESYFAISVDTLWAIRGHTVQEGPIVVGWAHGDLSVSEIKEALVAELIDPSNIIVREHARRPVRRSGIFIGTLSHEVLNDGRPIRTPMRFTIDTGHTWQYFAFNQSGAALTTGTVLEVHGVMYGRWNR